MASSEDIQLKIDQAATAGEEFSKYYYECFDKKRYLLHKLYMDNATLIWNGNHVSGSNDIMKYFEQFPTTETTLESLDCQPILDEAVNGQSTILVVVSGVVKYERVKTATFQQNFMLTAQGTVWKVVTDWFRFQEPLRTS
ncbi:PREDICTED: NTF2-related export protein 2-like [Priapulus caudatus]|uniref:NTF2-related export protein n=1 Tax=Priapulus caudatus TaxID=37621 RepID=A0ABM1DT44_PRICU|nr:PREDICTED: NTF2-related export protein 2-like [Priapulus caudatus]